MTAGLPSPTPVVPTSPTKGKHSPERSCVACRRKRPQGEFLRLSRVDGIWAMQTGNRTGRGSYLCADTPACWAEKRLRRAFGAQAASLSAQLQTFSLNQGAPTQSSSRPAPSPLPLTSVSPSGGAMSTDPTPHTMQ